MCVCGGVYVRCRSVTVCVLLVRNLLVLGGYGGRVVFLCGLGSLLYSLSLRLVIRVVSIYVLCE